MDRKFVLVLIAISCIQTLLITYLIFNQNQPRVVQLPSTQNSDIEDSDLSFYKEKDFNRPSDSKIDEQTIRSIIRQELAAHQAINSDSNNNKNTHKNKMQSPSSPEILNKVNEQFDIYLSTGHISQKEMELFHTQISQLSPKDRTASLSRLAKSINRGEIKFTN
ncbi:MAG: hypothetical protein OQJ89_05770 [Kangiellaceae bacterium]|nr:hypothetical protein [Kangiellaceae bacterium]MCW9000982.1 hypothetical protein [Kangiellaceae bacterium]MCW9016449.1 hypothetical protein [Kangiellaceae bacterium]